MDRMTTEQAASLLDHIETLTAKVDVAEEQARRTRRLTRWLLGVTALLVVGSLVLWSLVAGLDQAQDDIQASRVQQCENANATRAGQRKIWSFFFEVTSAANQDAPKAVLDFYDAYVKWITTEVLPDRDCTDLSKDYPAPAAPPSYKEALREAQAQERAEKRR